MKALDFFNAFLVKCMAEYKFFYNLCPDKEKESRHPDECVEIGKKVYHNFLSRPFNPADISVLFGGWEKSTLDQTNWFNGNLSVSLMDGGIKLRVKYKTRLIYMPQTLNDFLSDCKRAGIDLEWTEKAIEMMKGSITWKN